MSIKWKMIAAITLALVLMSGTLLYVSNRSYQAGKKAQGEPMVIKSEPAAPVIVITKDDIERIVDKKFDTFANRVDELSEARRSERQETLAAVDESVEKALAAARAQNWREYQADFARRGVALTGLTVSVASPALSSAQFEPGGNADPPQPSAEPQP